MPTREACLKAQDGQQENSQELREDILHSQETFREGPSRPGAETGRRIRTQEQERGLEGEVQPGQDQDRRPELLTLDEKDPKRLFEGNALLRRLVRTGVLAEDRMKLDYVLALKTEDFMERRLQTQVFKLGLAKSVHHARVLIKQRHIRVRKQVVNIPSFIVRLDSQKHI